MANNPTDNTKVIQQMRTELDKLITRVTVLTREYNRLTVENRRLKARIEANTNELNRVNSKVVAITKRE
jgi:regulator of replication initiation timing